MNIDLTVYEIWMIIDLLEDAKKTADKFEGSDLETIIYKLEEAMEEFNKD
jgi:hypothetical protein